MRDNPANPYVPSATVSTPRASKPSHRFKWHSVAIAVSTLVAIEWLFIITGWIWYPVFQDSTVLLPLSVAIIMIVIAVVVLRVFKAMTGSAIAVLAIAIAIFALINAEITDVLAHV